MYHKKGVDLQKKTENIGILVIRKIWKRDKFYKKIALQIWNINSIKEV